MVIKRNKEQIICTIISHLPYDTFYKNNAQNAPSHGGDYHLANLLLSLALN
jgi:hypothetical protein